ncbi:MAG: xanthine phosphoribosyltransferase [Oribacterium sp.]|nr:xanthine phosphoribosyltransferase [Oribacterium sp.]
MKILEDAILEKGEVYPGNILKVDGFLNHQVDTDLTDKMASAFYEWYKDSGITKVLTIEASGIPVAYAVARFLGVPMLFAKKTKSLNLGEDVYSSRVSSYTHNTDYDVTVSRKYLDSADIVLLMDDFLARGNAMKGLIEICDQAGARVAGIGICIEKGFQPGGEDLRMMGYDVMSLAIIEKMSDDGTIVFQRQDN